MNTQDPTLKLICMSLETRNNTITKAKREQEEAEELEEFYGSIGI